jgi:hypothetical protein
MSSSKLSISLKPDLRAAITKAAERLDLPVSEWFSQAAEAKLRNQLLGDFLDDWEQEHGAFSEAEIEAAKRTLLKKTSR